MRVSLTTQGGLAAAFNQRLPPRVADTDHLPPEAADELRRLVEAASAESGGTDRPHPAARDAMTYTITVEDGPQPTTLTASDTTMSAPFATLLTWIEQHT